MRINVLDLKILDVVTTLMNKYDFYHDKAKWTSSEESKCKEEAHKAACADAKQNAQIIAKELGVRITGVHMVSVNGAKRIERGRNRSMPGFLSGEGETRFCIAESDEGSQLVSKLSIEGIQYRTKVTVEFCFSK